MRWIARFVLLIVVAVAAILLFLRSAPRPDSTITAKGLSAPVSVVFDRFGIPTVTAASERDAAFAMGYLHASERLFQMELTRRAGAGRLSEYFGARALPTDKFMRTLGLYRAAKQQYDEMAVEARGVLDAYADGVNTWLATRKTALPPEYYLLQVSPEPWQPADSLILGKLLALQLAGNFRDELLRARLMQRLSPDEMNVLFPPYPKGAPSATGETASLLKSIDLDKIYAALPAMVGPTFASNNWVVDGAHSVSGKPMLANDPHLALTGPGVWYLAHIKTPDMDVTGVTAPCVPYVVLGHNADIAWGFTTTTGDVEDLFIEKPDPADAGKYQTPDGSKPFVTRAEKILVSGGEPVTITVRETRHGPVISDLGGDYAEAAPKDAVLALQSTWLMPDDHTPEALRGINRAKNWDDFRNALKLFGAPEQNMVFADVAGNIGFIAPAKVPIRAKGDGSIPSPGWSGEYDWTGFIPFDELPTAYNPPNGRIVTANAKITPENYPHFISRDWDYPNRQIRINQMLDTKPKFSLDDFSTMQADTLSLMAKDLVPLMTAISPTSPTGQRAIERLKSWNGRMDRDLVEPLLFVAWLRELNRGLFAQKLGPVFADYWGARPLIVKSILTEHKEWCAGDCAPALSAALDRAIDLLTKQYGDDLGGWTWGRAHRAPFTNQVWANVPLIGAVAAFDLPTDGGSDTVNRGEMRYTDEVHPFAHTHGPGLRTVIDMAAPMEARFLTTPGQSGNPFSEHYGDLAVRWRDFTWFKFAAAPNGVHLTLQPGS